MSDPVEDEGGVDEIKPEELGLLPTDLSDPSTPAPVSTEASVLAAAAALRQKNAAAQEPYKLWTVEDLDGLPDPQWVAKDVIRRGELGVLYGPPSCGKTFVALDLGLCIAEGKEWFGHRVLKGPIVFLAGEGGRGIRRRIKAWAAHHNVDAWKLDIRVLPHSIRFLEPTEFKRLLAALRQLTVQPNLIVTDTFARYFSGDENSAQEVGQFIDLSSQLRDATGAASLMIHHEGKSLRGPRGSSALHGAIDVLIQVRRENGQTVVVGEKSKDDEPLAPHYFKTKYIWLGTDAYGDKIGSLVLERGEAPKEEAAESATPASTTPTEKPDHGATIRHTLATMFGGKAAGGPLLKASRLKDSTFYEALGVEIEADRIRTVGTGRYPFYELTPSAPEYRSPSPSPSPEGEMDSDSPGHIGSERRESESESDTPPLGVSAASNSESRSDLAHSRPHQKKKQKRAKTTKPERKRHPKPHQDASKAASEQSPAQSPGVPSSAKSDGSEGAAR